VGDPSGKSELRKLLGSTEVLANLEAQKEQLSRYLDLAPAPDPSSARGFVVNNADWLSGLNYIEFLRDIGRHISVNRMLAAESVQLRLESESGLSFLEFNYSILQAYDFLVLNQRYDCELQMGGSDQWGNIVAGIDLIRRVARRRAHCITFPLITTAGGRKMGKTEAGAVWLDAGRTSPYEFHQYWINADDRDVGRFLRMFTLLDIEEIAPLERLAGADIREAKKRLAFEATALTHGEGEARKAEEAAGSLFSAGGAGDAAAVPSIAVARSALAAGVPAVELAVRGGIADSKGAARRLAAQSGLYANGEAVPADRVITLADLKDGAVLLRAGKKKHVRVVPE
jgi:tyrosyl-tRNA synthetase